MRYETLQCLAACGSGDAPADVAHALDTIRAIEVAMNDLERGAKSKEGGCEP